MQAVVRTVLLSLWQELNLGTASKNLWPSPAVEVVTAQLGLVISEHQSDIEAGRGHYED